MSPETIFEQLASPDQSYSALTRTFPADNYMFEVNNRTRGDICSKLTTKTPERIQPSMNR